MRNLSIFTVLLVSCSTFQKPIKYHRDPGSIKSLTSSGIEISLTDKKIFANGANQVYLKVSIKDESGSPEAVNAADIKVISDSPVGVSKFAFSQGIFVAGLKPVVKSPDIKIYVQWKDKVSQIIELKTTLAPLKDKLTPLPLSASEMSYVSELNYIRQDNFKEGLYEGFSIDNRGSNRIVNAEDSMREYEFNFEEQASQNIHLMLSDMPNGTVSHTMHSVFAFFPRKYLPYAEIKNKEVTVTLPTGEKMVFAESGEIKDGVFKEGPVDTGPDRFKRTYADLKYQGKGILLRANARGQMPQQGQFESTKIDMEYGIKYSADVLIINGTTGQRCRRPKSDFWPSGDVSPIMFKFPSDKEFDVYLKAKCGFGIPEISEVETVQIEDAKELIEEVWSKCETASDVEACVKDESALIENLTLRGKVRFELNLRLLSAKQAESEQINALINNEIGPIREELLKNAFWVSDFSSDQKFQDSCLVKSRSLVKGSFRFHDIQALIKDSLVLNCSTVKAEMIRLGASEVVPLKTKLEADFAWASVASKEKLIADCQKQAASYITSEFRFHAAPAVYASALKPLCEDIEKSEAFQNWIKTQSAGLEDRIYAQIMLDIESAAEERARYCINEYPVDTQLNRLRFKRQRESCLVDEWDQIEQIAISKAKKDPLVQRVGLSFEGLNSRISMERRRLQLKIMKKYFL